MSLVVLLLLFGVLYLYWLYTRYQRLWRYIGKMPGPTPLPLIGNLHQVGATPESYMKTLQRWFKEHNFECFLAYGGPTPYVFILNPKSFEAVLSSSTLTYKKTLYEFVTPWLGNGLLTSNGEHWLKHRKLITPSFHFQILQDFLCIMNETTDRFIGLLDTFTKDEKMFDFQDVVTRSTIDIICETAMGTRVNAIEGRPSAVVKAMNDICFVIQSRVFGLMKQTEFLFRLTPSYRLQERSLKVLRQELSKIIQDRREFLRTSNANFEQTNNEFKRPKMAFLDNLLTATKDGQFLTFQEIFEEVSTFMFEGHDTTASAITFTVFCLSRHPDVQERAFSEQFQIFGSNTKRNPTYLELQDMKYLELVIKESLRLFPSVPFIARTMTQQTEIGGYIIPEGVGVVLPIIAVATDERNFDQPFVFRPERFTLEERENKNPFEYVPFSAGPRNCIGQKFAMMELKTTVSKILRNFEILPAIDGLPSGLHDPANNADIPSNPYDPKLAVMVTLKSTNGVYIRLRRRRY